MAIAHCARRILECSRLRCSGSNVGLGAKRAAGVRCRPVRRGLFLWLTALALAAGGSGQTAVAADAKTTKPRQLVVAAVQAKLQPCYEQAEFAKQMDQYMQDAMKSHPQLVVFPEDIGIMLVVLNDRDILADCKNQADAVMRLTGRYGKQAYELKTRYKVSPMRALWLAKLPAIKDVYRQTFADLAKKYKVHILAGSTPIVMPKEPSKIYSAACWFAPDGRPKVVALKVNSLPLEKTLDFSAGKATDARVFEVAGVKVGVLMCLDAWQSEAVEHLVKNGAEVLVQVAANPKGWSEQHRLGWRQGLYAQVQRHHVYGVSCMGVGTLFDLPFQGQSTIIAPADMAAAKEGILQEAKAPAAAEVLSQKLTFPLPSKG